MTSRNSSGSWAQTSRRIPVSRTTALSTVSTLALFAAAACSDTSRVSAPSRLDAPPQSALTLPGCNATRLYQLVSLLSPSPMHGPRSELNGRVTSALAVSKNQLDLGQKMAQRVAAFLGDDAVLARLADPNGSAPPTKSEAVSELVNVLFTCAQLPAPGDIAGA